MMKQILGTILALLLMATPAGVAYGQGDTASKAAGFDVVLKTLKNLRSNQQNTFKTLCEAEQLNRDTIKSHLNKIKPKPDDDWKKVYGEENAKALGLFVETCRKIGEGNKYDDPACKQFIEAYIENHIADIHLETPVETSEEEAPAENENTETTTASSENTAPEASVMQSDLPQLIQIHPEALQAELTRLTHILYILLALVGITFIFLIALFFKSQRPAGMYPKDPLRDDRDLDLYATNKSVKQIGEKVQALEQTLKLLDKDVKARLPLPGTTQSVATTTVPPLTPTPPQPDETPGAPTAPPFASSSAGSVAETNTPPKGFTTLYVSVKAGEPNTLFKQTPILTRDHLYEIHLKSPDAQEGELHICPNIGPEFARKFINQRMQYLQPCEILSALTNAEKICMVSCGVVQKRGSEWMVTTPPKVKLI